MKSGHYSTIKILLKAAIASPLGIQFRSAKILQAARYPSRTNVRVQQAFLPILLEKRRSNCDTSRAMADSSIKLYYFDEDGRAEVSRLVLTVAGKAFEDIRFSFDDWPKLKPTMPFNQVPVLEVDGKKYAQSLAIPTFLAREFGLYGQTNLDGLKIDMIAQLVLEFRLMASKHYYEQDTQKKAEIAKKLTEQEAPKYLGFLDNLLKDNGGEFMVGSDLTLADIIVFDVFTGALGKFVQPSSCQFPQLQKLVDRVGNIDKIRNYIATTKTV